MIIYNNIIPFKGYLAISIFPFIFARNDAHKLTDVDENHEKIHLRQQLEVMIAYTAIIACLVMFAGLSTWFFLSIPFIYYILYVLEYIIRVMLYENQKEGYRNISHEQEAYNNEDNLEYRKHRKLFSWVKYLTKKTYTYKKPLF
jgi:hypothetical protein